MSLRSEETLEAFVNKIITNKDIMDILKLPTILKTDTDAIKSKKRIAVIDKAITKTAQEPVELNKKFTPIEIDGIRYENFGETRVTIAFAPSIKTGSYLFGNPQIDINIYYDNTKGVPFKLLDLISDEFSGKTLKVEVENGKQIIKNIKCEGLTSQVAIINNYERMGIRFSFYATFYKN